MTEEYCLGNGLRILVDPMPSLETVALGVRAHAGSVDERPEEHGLAHLLEHMAFKGTKTRTARQIAEEIESIGGYLNAATSHQRTGYYVRLLKDDVALGLDILSDILLHPLFEEKELVKEQDVVVQEIGEVADTPDDVVFELLQEATWDGHPLSRPILGTPETVRAQTPASLRDFMKRNYQPASMVVAISGSIDTESILPLVQEKFGAMNGGGEGGGRNEPRFKGGLRHDSRDIEQTHLAIALPGVSLRHKDFFATRIFADTLGGGMSSRLFQLIREDRGLAYSVYAFADGYEECGLVGAYVGADEGQIGEAAKLIRGEIEAMVDGVDQAEIDRARAMLKASLMMGLESPAARIENATGQLFAYGRTLPPQEIVDRLESVTVEDVKRCASRALDGASSLAVVGPGDAEAASRAFHG